MGRVVSILLSKLLQVAIFLECWECNGSVLLEDSISKDCLRLDLGSLVPDGPVVGFLGDLGVGHGVLPSCGGTASVS